MHAQVLLPTKPQPLCHSQVLARPSFYMNAYMYMPVLTHAHTHTCTNAMTHSLRNPKQTQENVDYPNVKYLKIAYQKHGVALKCKDEGIAAGGGGGLTHSTMAPVCRMHESRGLSKTILMGNSEELECIVMLW